MADLASTCSLEVLDELWFHQNILFPRAPHISLKTSSKQNGIAITPSPDLKTKFCSASLRGDNSPSKSGTENKRSPADHRGNKLNIVIGQPLFQLQPPARSEVRSHPLLPSLNTGLEPKVNSRRKPSKMRSYKSLSDLENYELKGFMDMGFRFQKEKLNPEIMSMIPGLQRLVNNETGSSERRVIDEGQVKRPYLSEAWLISRPDSPLLNLQVLPKSVEGSHIKKHLRSWARKVASLVQQESPKKSNLANISGREEGSSEGQYTNYRNV